MSPQTKIAQKFKPMLFQDPTQIDWEIVMLDLIDQVRTQPGMDPVLRVALLRKVLELGLEGSEPLQAALGGLKNQVDQADVDVNVPWMDPENREAEQMRPKAAAFVRSPARPDGAAQGCAGAAVDGPAAAGGPPAGGGLAGPRAGGLAGPHRGGLAAARDPPASRSPGNDGHGVWKKIGAIDQGRPRLTVADDPALAEGRPVFVVVRGRGRLVRVLHESPSRVGATHRVEAHAGGLHPPYSNGLSVIYTGDRPRSRATKESLTCDSSAPVSSGLSLLRVLSLTFEDPPP